MSPADVHKLIHDLRNSLNTISINTCLIRRLHKDTIDPEILGRLDVAVKESDQIMAKFQAQMISNQAKQNPESP